MLAALGPPLLVFRGPDGRSSPRPGAPPLTGRLAFGLFGAVVAGVMSLLNTRLTSFGIADLRGGIGLDVDLSTWVTTAFSVGNIAIVPATPWLTDIFSSRRMFVASILLTTVSAIALGTLPTYPFTRPVAVPARSGRRRAAAIAAGGGIALYAAAAACVGHRDVCLHHDALAVGLGIDRRLVYRISLVEDDLLAEHSCSRRSRSSRS